MKTRTPLLIAIICFAWASCSIAPIWKYLPHTAAAVATLLISACITFGLQWFYRRRLKHGQISLGWLWLIFAVLTTLFIVLYPHTLQHIVNRGSDREDAIQISLTAIEHHQYPYDMRTYLGNPPTPLPGALLLALPFFAFSHVGLQNIFWLAAFILFLLRFFSHRATTLIFLLIFVLLSPSNLSDFISSGDYLTNFFYIAIALFVFIHSLNTTMMQSIVCSAFLGLALSSRGIYWLVLPPLFPLVQQITGRHRAIAFYSVIAAAGSAITLPVFWPHPIFHLLHQLDQSSSKLRHLPSPLHAKVVLPLLALLLSSYAFRVKMNLPKLFLLFGAATLIVLAPPIVAIAVATHHLPFECSYLAISTCSLGLWAFKRLEEEAGISQLLHPATADKTVTIH